MKYFRVAAIGFRFIRRPDHWTQLLDIVFTGSCRFHVANNLICCTDQGDPPLQAEQQLPLRCEPSTTFAIRPVRFGRLVMQVTNTAGFMPVVPVPLLLQTSLLDSIVSSVPNLLTAACERILMSFDQQTAVIYYVVSTESLNSLSPQVLKLPNSAKVAITRWGSLCVVMLV